MNERHTRTSVLRVEDHRLLTGPTHDLLTVADTREEGARRWKPPRGEAAERPRDGRPRGPGRVDEPEPQGQSLHTALAQLAADPLGRQVLLLERTGGLLGA